MLRAQPQEPKSGMHNIHRMGRIPSPLFHTQTGRLLLKDRVHTQLRRAPTARRWLLCIPVVKKKIGKNEKKYHARTHMQHKLTSNSFYQLFVSGAPLRNTNVFPFTHPPPQDLYKILEATVWAWEEKKLLSSVFVVKFENNGVGCTIGTS